MQGTLLVFFSKFTSYLPPFKQNKVIYRTNAGNRRFGGKRTGALARKVGTSEVHCGGAPTHRSSTRSKPETFELRTPTGA